MNLKSFVLTIFLFAGMLAGVSDQGNLKMGYANINVILENMTETQTMNQTLASIEKKLAEDLQSREQYLQTLAAELQEMMEQGKPEAELQPKRDEINKLYATLQQKQGEAPQKLMTRRQDLMEPIVAKIQKEIDALATEEGYTYIFNTIDGSGVSIILKGPESDNLTMKLATRLGIKLPSEDAAAGGN